MRLEPLSLQHLEAVLDFETVNREYFAASIPDRGDDFFADYPARHAALLRMQDEGTDRFHVLVTGDDGRIAGRFNLTDIRDGEAELGYRVGRDFTGRGVATDGVRRVRALAGTAYGIKRLRAGTSTDNHGSQKVLLRNGFVLVDGTDPGSLSFILDLS